MGGVPNLRIIKGNREHNIRVALIFDIWSFCVFMQTERRYKGDPLMRMTLNVEGLTE